MNYDNHNDDLENDIPEDDDSGQIPWDVDPDDPDFDFYQRMKEGNPRDPMFGGMKFVPDGRGGFKGVPLSPEEISHMEEFWRHMRGMSHPIIQNNPDHHPAFNPTQFPHYYLFNHEYILQFVTGVNDEGSDSTIYMEIVPNPVIKPDKFKYDIFTIYEDIQSNQLLTFLVALQTGFFLWDTECIKMSIVDNVISDTESDKKIVIIAKCSRNRPDWFEALEGMDFTGFETTDVVTPFANLPVQIYRNVYIKKHIYEPLVRVEATFTLPSNWRTTFTEDTIDMYGVYNTLVLPAIISGLEILYPVMANSSKYSRETLESVHLSFETRITDYMLEVIAYIAPAYAIDVGAGFLRLAPLGGGMIATSVIPLEVDLTKLTGGVCGNLFKTLNHTCSSSESQVFSMSLKPLGNLDIYNRKYLVSLSHQVFFIFGRYVSPKCLNFWEDDNYTKMFNCEIKPSKYDFIHRYIVPDEEVLVPKNPDECKLMDQFFKFYGFIEVNVVDVNSIGMKTFADVILVIQDEIIETFELTSSDFKDLRENPSVLITEVYGDGPIFRLLIFRIDEYQKLASPRKLKYLKEVCEQIDDIQSRLYSEEDKNKGKGKGLFGFMRQ